MEKVQVKKFSVITENKEQEGLIEEEIQAVRLRRKKLELKTEKAERSTETQAKTKAVEPDLIEDAPFDTFAIALSGGGIRSATFNLGFLKALNDQGIFRHADYLSTVSGGGYLGSFVQNRLKQTHNYDTLFAKEEIDHLKAHGDYLRPGKGWRKVFESFNFYLNTLIQILLHSLWFLLFFAFTLFTFIYVGEQLPDTPAFLNTLLLSLFLALLVWYYFFHPLRYISKVLWSAKCLFYSGTVLVILIAAAGYSGIKLQMLCDCFGSMHSIVYVLGFGLLMITTGFFANPNILSSHRFYRFRLKDAFLHGSDTKLCELAEKEEGKKWTFAPYPLINTTLNLQADKAISGMKSCDYFLLSPLYCGSKITGYIPTDKVEYRRMTLATALTISGAAVNPSMGYKSNRLLSFFMTLLNLRLGYWALNPKIFDPSSYETSGLRSRLSAILRQIAVWTAEKYRYALTLWPYYNIAELFGTMHSRRIRVNLSDGGNIENLAVFELLRRKCKLIIASDAGADPDYSFSDLQNLLIRARNELEISIEFPDEQDPEKLIHPDLCTGQSRQHYAIGRIYELPEAGAEKQCIGYFVYVKASVTAQTEKLQKEERKNDFYSYKNYHPDFPHESTVDQFFDAKQWEAYRTLGEEIGKDLFKTFKTYEGDKNTVSIQNLIHYFEDQLK
ncbi:hypothetical protein YH65_04295 [Sulfurovum lithotrophicum]|uniref:PNPLA domain-containing protein n=1 Tax=Sulfurovum lithotrophicum TaxID=206403 RepID=A0A7U4M0P3_9BACT|nr:patatin-like phospholipase family protein [Sulfurovum lithotrophicum]AKF24693.1 hypothetical protein YH65_04295 [Sulfurovum lithotrophicum]